MIQANDESIFRAMCQLEGLLELMVVASAEVHLGVHESVTADCTELCLSLAREISEKYGSVHNLERTK
ncbi:hypothetical protein [Pseudothauera rhizosphaerae]|uniref:Uncharacterized protein n=1 Tax=Pseudothauera rhizosphaerae TaxID=2565932 RepID=A0A4S4B081_9RHOO|nr:hypothetical protein [Pseudothauera rhizosphaerae]THF64265.1 hypothetical protein E6O51_02805 [Pseudothauera rhizosphaerae]